MNTRLLRLLVHGILGALFFLSQGYFLYDNLQAGDSLGGSLLNSLGLGIPLAALFISAGVLWEAWLRHRRGGLGRRMRKLLFFAPRIAGILVAVFTGLFALDVFDMPGSTGERLLAFIIHAAPAIVMIGLLALAWRWEWVGALAFGAAAIYMLRSVSGDWFSALGNLLLFVLPAALVAILFWLNWRWRGEIKRLRGAGPA